MNGTLRSPLACAASLLLMGAVGCVSIGQEFPAAEAQKLRIGETTRDEVQALFGNPLMTGFADGNPSWTYARVRYSVFGAAQAAYLEVQFDAQGRVHSWSVNQTP